MKYILLVTNKNAYTFPYINDDNWTVKNKYSDPRYKNPLKVIARIFLYFTGFKAKNAFLGDWINDVDKDDVQFVIVDEAGFYHRHLKYYKKLKNRPIFYFWNPVHKYHNVKLLKKYGSVWTYSKADAEKFGINFTQQFLPKLPDTQNKYETKYDGIFIGRNKNRLKTLERLFVQFKNPFFFVVRDFLERSKLIKLRSFKERLPYKEYVEKLRESTCVVEIASSTHGGLTLRAAESIIYQKKLVTNVKDVKDLELYKYGNIYIFDKNSDLEDLSVFIEKEFTPYPDELVNVFSVDAWKKRFSDGKLKL